MMGFAAMLAAGSAWAPAASAASLASGTGSGTSIGNAKTVSTVATGSLTTYYAQAWYVMYPKTAGGTVVAEVTDTTASGNNCQDLSVTMDNSDGSSLASGQATPGAPLETPISSQGSDRYYIEINTSNGCPPVSGEPATFSVSAVSGAGGKAPDPAKGSITAGASIGQVGAELQGHTVYSGSVPATDSQEWYQLYKADDTGTATIRVADTTVSGTATCPYLSVSFDNSDGTSIGSANLSDNTAAVFSIADTGQYYLEITSWNDNGYACGGSTSAGATYSIEPEPAAEWTTAPTGPDRSPLRRTSPGVKRLYAPTRGVRVTGGTPAGLKARGAAH